MSSQDQRHGRLLVASGITFNGVPLSPLTTPTAVENEEDDDVVVVDARAAGKRKVRDGEEEGHQGRGIRGSQGNNNVALAPVHGAGAESSGVRRGRGRGGGGGGEQACMLAERERDQRRRMNDMFTDIRRIVPNLSEKSNRVEVVDGAIAYIQMLKDEEAKLEELKLERDRLVAGRASSAAVTVAAYAAPVGVGVGGASTSSAAAAVSAAAARANTVPTKARGAVAPTPRPVAPQVRSWPLPAPAAMPPPPPPAAAGAVASAAAAARPASLKTWSWGSNVVVSVLGNIGNMTVRSPMSQPGVLTMVSAMMQKYNITVITSLSGIDPSQTQNMFMFYTSIDTPDRPPQFVNPKVFEAMYRAAASEIAGWVSTY